MISQERQVPLRAKVRSKESNLEGLSLKRGASGNQRWDPGSSDVGTG